jgi:hypothetical protein
MDSFYKPIDFSRIVGYPHDLLEIAIENFRDFHNYDDANAHIKAFGQSIDEWCDPPIHVDVLMKLFVLTICEEDAYDWFHDSDDNEFKTIQDLMHAFLERWGNDQIETYNELVDAFMEKWKEKELPDIETINSYIKIDTSPNPIKELKEIIEAMQLTHAKQCEAIQLAMEKQFEAMEISSKSWKLTLSVHMLVLNIRTL